MNLINAVKKRLLPIGFHKSRPNSFTKIDRFFEIPSVRRAGGQTFSRGRKVGQTGKMRDFQPFDGLTARSISPGPETGARGMCGPL